MPPPPSRSPPPMAASEPLIGAAPARSEPTGRRLSPSVALLLPSVALGTISVTLLLPILPTIKAHWYTGECNTYSVDGDCKPDFRRASQYSGIFSSVRFLLIFLVSSLLGRLSDSIGRIPLLRLNNLAQMTYVVALLASRGDSAVAYFLPWTLSGLLSSGTFQVVAYIADSVPSQERLTAFGLVGAVSGAGLALTPLLSAFSGAVTNQDMFFLSLLCLVINALYIEMVLPESLVARKPFARQESLNPVTPILAPRESSTMKWLSLVTFLTALPESGVAEIAILYLDDSLGLQGEEAREFASTYLALTGVGLLVSQTVFLRYLPLILDGPISLLLLSAACNLLHMLIYTMVALFPSKALAFSNIIVTSFMFIGATQANSLLSAHMSASEQGFAMGTLDSVRSLVGAFGPLFFSQLFKICGDEWGMPEVPFILGMVLVALSLVVIAVPLRQSLKNDALSALFAEGSEESGGSHRGSNLNEAGGAEGIIEGVGPLL